MEHPPSAGAVDPFLPRHIEHAPEAAAANDPANLPFATSSGYEYDSPYGHREDDARGKDRGRGAGSLFSPVAGLARGRRRCPSCGELVARQAAVCRFCNTELSAGYDDAPRIDLTMLQRLNGATLSDRARRMYRITGVALAAISLLVPLEPGLPWTVTSGLRLVIIAFALASPYLTRVEAAGFLPVAILSDLVGRSIGVGFVTGEGLIDRVATVTTPSLEFVIGAVLAAGIRAVAAPTLYPDWWSRTRIVSAALIGVVLAATVVLLSGPAPADDPVVVPVTQHGCTMVPLADFAGATEEQPPHCSATGVIAERCRIERATIATPPVSRNGPRAVTDIFRTRTGAASLEYSVTDAVVRLRCPNGSQHTFTPQEWITATQ